MLLTQTELTELTQAYYRDKQGEPERMGQFLLNRTPLKINDPDLFYEKDDGIAVHKYQERYIVASMEEVKAWAEARNAEDVPKVNIQEVKDLIQKVEFSTSGSDGSCYTTNCILTTNFGFKVSGKSGTIHEDRFSEEVCKRFAFEKAFNNLVDNHSYLVRYNLHQAGLTLVRTKKPKG